MIELYLDELRSELAAVGIHGRLQRRILVEAEDHLSADGGALDRFGSPAEIADAFAAELGARASRRAAVGAFLALGAAGAVFAVSFVSAQFAGQPAPDTWPLLAQLALVAAIVAPQVSFVAGSLALVRVLRRREPVLPSAELTVINRRTGVALLFGLVTMAALGVLALELRNDSADWWVALTLVGVALATPLLVLAAVRLPAPPASGPVSRAIPATCSTISASDARIRGASPAGSPSGSGSSSSSPRPSRAIRSTAPSMEPPRRSPASRASRRSAAI